MAEDLASLYVSLNLKSETFEQGMRRVTKQLQASDAEFQANIAQSGKMADSFGALGQKSDTLKKRLATQQNAAKAYKTEMDSLNKALLETNKRQQALKPAIEAARKVWENSKAALAQYEQELGKGAEATKKQAEETKRLEGEHKKLQGQYDSNDRKQKKHLNSLERAEIGYQKMRREVALTSNELSDSFGVALDHAAQKMDALSNKLMKGVTLPIAGGMTAAAKAAIDYEDAFAGVEKTVNATDAELDRLSGTILEMSGRLPFYATEIARTMEAAGQLGVSVDDIEKFTEVMLMMGQATDLASEDAATSIAQFAAITGMPLDEVNEFGSAIVELGNNTATTESKILGMATRLASAGSQIGMTEADIVGLSATLASLGLEEQAGGSAFSKIMKQMALDVETGKGNLKNFAEVAGVSAKEFASLFREDATSALSAFILGLGDTERMGKSTIAMLDEMGLTELRLSDALMRTSNASGMLTDNLRMSNDAWSKGNALQEEAGKRNATTASRLKTLKSQVVNTGISFGNVMLPTLENLIEKLSSAADWLGTLDESTRSNLLMGGGIAAAAGPTLKVLGKITGGLGKVAKGIGGIALEAEQAGGGVKGLGTALASSLGTKGLVGLAAAGAVGLGVLAFKLYDVASGAKALREATAKLSETTKEWQSTQAKTVFDSGQDPFERFHIDKDTFGSVVEETRELKKLDKEYDKLIQRMGSERGLSEKQKERLAVVSEQRINLRLELGEITGFEQIETSLDAELARLEALDIKPSAEVFADALKAAGQGKVAALDTLDQQYAAQYAEIAKLTDETQRKNEIDALNNKYLSERNEILEAYGNTVQKISPDLLATEEVQKGEEGLTRLLELVEKLSNVSESDNAGRESIITDINNALQETGEGNLVSYLAVLTQLQELANNGTDVEGLFPGSLDNLQDFEKLKGYLEYIKDNAPELYSALAEAVPDEVDRVTGDMGVTLTEFTISDDAELPVIDGLVGVIQKVEEGEDVSTEDLLGSLTAIVTSYTNGASEEDLEKLDPRVRALITAYNETEEGNASRGSLLSAITGYINYYNDETARKNMKPLEIPATVVFNQNIMNEAMKGVSDGRGFLGIGQSEIEGIKTATEAIELYNEAVRGANGAAEEMQGTERFHAVMGIGNLPEADAQNMLTFMEQYRALLLSGQAPTEEMQAYAESVSSLISAMSEMDLPEDQQKLVDDFLAPFKKLFGAGDNESLATYLEGLKTLGGDIVAGIGEGMTEADVAAEAQSTIENLEQALRAAAQSQSPAKYYNPLGKDISAGIGDGAKKYSFLSDATKTIGNAKNSLTIARVSNNAAFNTIGSQIAAGIGAGAAAYDFTAYAEQTIGNLKTALSTAAGIASPAKFFMPTGAYSAAGVGLGMREYDFLDDARATAGNIERALSGELEGEMSEAAARLEALWTAPPTTSRSVADTNADTDTSAGGGGDVHITVNAGQRATASKNASELAYTMRRMGLARR